MHRNHSQNQDIWFRETHQLTLSKIHTYEHYGILYANQRLVCNLTPGYILYPRFMNFANGLLALTALHLHLNSAAALPPRSLLSDYRLTRPDPPTPMRCTSTLCSHCFRSFLDSHILLSHIFFLCKVYVNIAVRRLRIVIDQPERVEGVPGQQNGWRGG